MIRRVLEWILVVLLALGGYFAWSTSQERNRLRVYFDRLVLETGELPIGDPTRVHVLALPTGEPLHFAWRISIPANYTLHYQGASGLAGGMGGRQFTKDPVEFIARVRLREIDGVVYAFQQFNLGGGTSNVGDKTLADQIRGHESEIGVEQFGSKGVETFGPDEKVTLLRLTLPKKLQSDPTLKLSPQEKRPKTPTLFTIEVGKKKSETDSCPLSEPK